MSLNTYELVPSINNPEQTVSVPKDIPATATLIEDPGDPLIPTRLKKGRLFCEFLNQEPYRLVYFLGDSNEPR